MCTYIYIYCFHVLQSDAEIATSKKNKLKKLDNRYRTKKSQPLNIIRHQIIDENAQLDTVLCHQSLVPTTLSPPPNATVVVCVLASTGRADLWVRNNRGQTPLDLCPADQPLRRALIKCCDAAARARNVDSISNAHYITNRSLPYETYIQFINSDPGSSKGCSKMLTKSRNPEFFDPETSFVDNSTASNWSPPPSQDDIESSQSQPTEMIGSVKIEATAVSTSASLNESLQTSRANETCSTKSNTDNSKNNNVRYDLITNFSHFFIYQYLFLYTNYKLLS